MNNFEKVKFVEVRLISGQPHLIAGWENSRGDVIRQTWRGRFRSLGGTPFGDQFTSWDDQMVSCWEMEPPRILTGVDPFEIIKWAKSVGKFEAVIGQ